MHYPPNIIRSALDQQMNVVRHQAIGVEVERQFVLLIADQREKLHKIPRIVEDVLPIDTTGDQMIKPALNFQPWSSRHRVVS